MDLLGSKYKVWVAQYPEKPYPETLKSSYSGKHAMWQFTGNGTVEGIEKAVDINVAYFSYKSIKKPKDPTPQEAVNADPAALIDFKEVNEIVTAKSVTNLRSVPSSVDPDTIVAVLHYGDRVKRTGIGNNGWSRLEYEGKIVYGVTSFLTTDLNYQENNTPTIDRPEAGITFEEVHEKVTAKIKTNLRLLPSAEDEETIVTTLLNGDVAIRTGIGDNGWSRVEYQGQTLYALTSYLTPVE